MIALGVGIGPTFANRVGSAVFDIASMFASGEQGVWYDPSDLDTLFQDTAGTTPVTTAAQTAQLSLDKSQGLVLGPESVTNGTFDDGTGWTLPAGSSISGGVLSLTSIAKNDSITNAATTYTSGEFYKITLEILNHISGRLAVQLSNGASAPSVSYDPGVGKLAANGTYSVILRSNGNTTFRVYSPVSGSVMDIDNISVRKLTGYHATQATGSFSPRYQVTPERLAFDGIDDRFAFPLNPTTSGTIAVRMNSTTASKIAVGVQGATDGRCYIGLASDGSLAGGIGAQATSVIKGTVDKRSTWVTGVLTWDGATVSLYQDGVSVYSAAQSGAVTTTVPFIMGGLNNNGTATAFHAGDIGECVILDRVMTPTEITETTAKWSTIE